MGRRWYVVGIAALAATIALLVDFGEDGPSVAPRGSAAASARTGQIARAGSRGVRALPPIARGELRLEGMVVDAADHPVGGAKVMLGGTRSATTEQDGSFAFDHLAAAEYDLTAESDGAYTEEREQRLTADSDPVTLTLRRSADVAVHVVAAETGIPIADAKVSSSDRVAYTDGDGVATLRSIATGMTRIEAVADGRAQSKIYVSTDDPAMAIERTIELVAGSDLSGLVVDVAGKPVAGASIIVETNGGEFRDWATSDDQGHWEFHGIAGGTQALSAFAEKHVATPDLAIETDGQHAKTDVIVRVELGGAITGVVVDAAGKPVAGARVRGYGRAETDAAGRFTLAGVPAGDYEIAATTDHSASPEIKLVLKRGEAADIKLVVGEGSLAGRVVDAHGLGTGDATVRAIHIASGRKWHAFVDDDGSFDFEGVEPGDYKVSVERNSTTYPDDPPAITAHAGNRKLRLVVPDVAKLVGRVVLGGRPVRNFGISVTAPDTYSTDATPVRTDTGRFERTDIAAGVWTVTIVGPEFAKTIVTGVRAIDGQTTDLGDIAVQPARVIAGRVLDQLGKPVANARVEVADGRPDDDDTMTRLMRDNAVVRSDASGAFRIANLPITDAELQISATHPTAGATMPRVLGATETEVTLVIETTGAIDGTIAHLDDRQLEAIATRVGTQIEASAEIEHGGFRFARLPAGDYDVRIHGSNTLSPIRVTVTANRRAQVAFALPIAPVTLRLDHDGCNLMELEDPTGHKLAFQTCKDGRAEIDNVSPGHYQICVDLGDCSPIDVTAGISVQILRVP